MKKELIELRVNGRTHELAIEPSKLLLDVLRQDLHYWLQARLRRFLLRRLHGTGGRRPMMSCTMLAASCEGQEITTIEGVSEHGGLAAFKKPTAIGAGRSAATARRDS